MIIIPHYDQWLGVWAMRPEELHAAHQVFNGLDLHVHLNSAQARGVQERGAGMPVEIRDGVAVVGLYGTLMKQESSLGRSTSTVLARRQIRAAAANDQVAAILLHIESPGGTAAGTAELAADVAAAARAKPVHAYIEDLGASAAYWVASQATRIYANATALVGSIGTYGIVHDLSGRAAKEGVKVHVVRAGEFKGSGEPGTEITPAQLAERQAIVDALNQHFLRGVQTGRGLAVDQVQKLADGRVYVGQAAHDLKLIDGIAPLDAVFSNLAAIGQKRRSSAMQLSNSAENSALLPDAIHAGGPAAAPAPSAPAPAAAAARPAAPAAASLADLEQACAGAPADFLLGALKAGMTVGQASTAWMGALRDQNTALQRQLAEQKTAAPAPAVPGVQRLPPSETGKPGSSSSSAASGDARAEFDEAVQAEMDRTRCSRNAAHAKICRTRPDLREAMVAAHNAEHAGRSRR